MNKKGKGKRRIISAINNIFIKKDNERKSKEKNETKNETVKVMLRIISTNDNIFLKKDSERSGKEHKKKRVEVTRDQTKSIFNFLWQNTLEGIKQTTL